MDDLSKLVGSQNQRLAGVNMDLNEHQEQALIGAEIAKVATLERELKKHKQANEALREALREVGEIATAVRRGDLSKRVQFQSVGTDPEIAICKRTINAMMSHLQDVSSNVSRLAREAGIEGILGGQASGAVEGTWGELITSGEALVGIYIEVSLTMLQSTPWRKPLRCKYARLAM
jgi:osomolarity two-component system, sensor histidine kinase NIK1